MKLGLEMRQNKKKRKRPQYAYLFLRPTAPLTERVDQFGHDIHHWVDANDYEEAVAEMRRRFPNDAHFRFETIYENNPMRNLPTVRSPKPLRATNKEGLTYSEWANAARTGPSDRALMAWQAGEDPTEWAAERAKPMIRGQGHGPPESELKEFGRAYINEALRTSTDNSTPSGGYPLDRKYTINDITKDTLVEMLKDATEFATAHWTLISHEHERAARDFWLTRNEHGAGFWDGDWPEPAATILEKASKKYGNYTLDVYRKKIHGTNG